MEDFKSPIYSKQSQEISGLNNSDKNTNEDSAEFSKSTETVNNSGVASLIDQKSDSEYDDLRKKVRMGAFVIFIALSLIGVYFLFGDDINFTNNSGTESKDPALQRGNSIDNLSSKKPVNEIQQGPSKPVGPVKPSDNNPNGGGMSDIPELTTSRNMFGIDVFRELVGEAVNENVIISPTSISLALSMALNGADGDTKSEIMDAMYLEGDLDSINQANLDYINSIIDSNSETTFESANSLWYKEDFSILDDYKKTVADYYLAEIESLNFADPEAPSTINTWVSDNTNGKIPTIITEVPSNAVAYLINALYFNGAWTTSFEVDSTLPREFTISDGSVNEIDTMNQTKDDFIYYEGDGFQSVKLPYGEDQRFSMYVFLPEDDIESFIENLEDESFQEWVGDYSASKGELFLPKFKLEYDTELSKQLKSIGVNSAFSPGFADFSNMTKADIHIDEVVHKTFIDVNEEGTEAAAVTAVELVEFAAVQDTEDSFVMDVNKPFLFMIVDDTVGEIIFLGAVQDPSE